MSERGRHATPTRRLGLMTAAAGAIGAALIGVGAGALTSPAAAAAKCTIDLSTSNDRPAVGQNITLTWSTKGADQLIASWTTATVPFSGTQVTTRKDTGIASYQVTGLSKGEYCGGATVSVDYVKAAAAPSSSAAPTTSAPVSSSAPATVSSTPASASVSAAPASTSATYPTQSSTGGSGVPWYEQPANLLAIGLVSLFSSLALFNRERFRAVFARRH